MNEVCIRPERTADQPAIFEVERLAFDSVVQPRLVDALRASAHPSVSLVAETGGDVVGHVFFSPVTFESPDAPAAAQLSPLAVHPDHQGAGIGATLIRAGLEACREVGWRAVFLVGNPLYYRRFGFEMAGPLGFSCGGPHDPFLQVIELAPGALTGIVGPIAFHPAFDEADAS